MKKRNTGKAIKVCWSKCGWDEFDRPIFKDDNGNEIVEVDGFWFDVYNEVIPHCDDYYMTFTFKG